MPREKKTEIITLRVTPRTKAVIQARAKSVNKTVTDCLCLCGLGKEIVQVEGLDKVLSELKAQGRNLNQLTTLANMGKVTILRGDALADKYEAICGQLCHLLREVN
ncbi:MAG: plasmid mobilization protein [Dysosmobacter welbionis]